MIAYENDRSVYFKIQKFVLLLALVSFLSYAYFKFFLLGLLALNFLFILYTQSIQIRLLYIWLGLAGSVFIAGIVGFVRGNDLERVLYEVYPVFFSLLGIIIVEKVRTLKDIHKILRDITFYIALLCFIIILIYFFLIYKIGIDGLAIFGDYINRFTPAFNFAGGGKIVTDFTPLILLIFPYALFNRKYILLAPIVIFILLSVSVAQYFCLFISLIYFLVRNGKFIPIVVFVGFAIAIASIVTVVTPELTGDFQSKFDNMTLENKDPATSGLTSRIVQAEILFSEFLDSPVLGKGLGYKSARYNSVRKQWGEVPDRNLSMYENQYLDILMKFGLPGALSIFFIYMLIPIGFLRIGFLNLKTMIEGASGHALVLIPAALGFFNFIFYVGSNGNQWYSPVSMFSWGLTVALLNNLSMLRQQL